MGSVRDCCEPCLKEKKQPMLLAAFLIVAAIAMKRVENYFLVERCSATPHHSVPWTPKSHKVLVGVYC